MRICLVRPAAPELLDDRLDPPLGLLLLGAALRTQGFEAQIVDCAGGVAVEIPDADLYGISVYTTSYPEALALRDAIRRRSDAPVVAGGPHATALPAETSRDFDYVCVGEAEITFPEIAPSLAARRRPDPIVVCRPPSNLDALPLAAYSLVDLDAYRRVVAGKVARSILSSRGCPFRCRYCATATLGGSLRLRSPESILEELRSLDRISPFEAVRFVDDNFLIRRRTFGELMAGLARLGRPFRIYCRASDLSVTRCQALVEAGCRMVACGVESGSARMHSLMGTRKDVRAMIQGLRSARRAGLAIRIGLIVGYPGETWETVCESIENLRRMAFDSYNLYNFVPFPGTDPYRRPERYGITWLSANWKDYFVLAGVNEASCAFEHRDLSRDTLARMRHFMIERLDQISRPALEDVENR
jgi:anaerobic magnesium-protoporphyrin IX monomethyl ester cyclase